MKRKPQSTFVWQRPGWQRDRAAGGASFKAAEVAEHYRHRPEYAPLVYQRLSTLAMDNTHLLDLGCGTGKIARNLSGVFQQVSAVDPSASMLKVARDMHRGATDNITWIEGFVEDTLYSTPTPPRPTPPRPTPPRPTPPRPTPPRPTP